MSPPQESNPSLSAIPEPQREAFLRAVAAFNAQQFFECHEIIEDELWRPLPPGPDKTFLQGWLQVAVGFLHWQRGNPVGANNLLKAGIEKLNTSWNQSVYANGFRVPQLIHETQLLYRQLQKQGVNSVPAFPKIVCKRTLPMHKALGIGFLYFISSIAAIYLIVGLGAESLFYMWAKENEHRSEAASPDQAYKITLRNTMDALESPVWSYGLIQLESKSHTEIAVCEGGSLHQYTVSGWQDNQNFLVNVYRPNNKGGMKLIQRVAVNIHYPVVPCYGHRWSKFDIYKKRPAGENPAGRFESGASQP